MYIYSDTTIETVWDVYADYYYGGSSEPEYIGATLTLTDGGKLFFHGFQTDGYSYPGYYNYGQTVDVSGKIEAEFTELADAIYAECPEVYLRVNGSISLKNANIVLDNVDGHIGGDSMNPIEHDHYDSYMMQPERIYVSSSASFSMEGGALTITPFIGNYDSEPTAHKFYNEGVVNLRDVLLDAYVEHYSGSFTANDCTFAQTINLSNYQSAGMLLQGKGNTFTCDNLIALGNYTGDFSDVWESGFIGSVRSSSPYISFATGGNVTVGKNAAGYENITLVLTQVKNGGSVTITEGSVLSVAPSYDYSSYAYIYGTVVAEFETNANAIVSALGKNVDLYISSNGLLRLSNANINLTSSSSSVIVASGGALELTGATVTGKVDIRSGASAIITGSRVQNLSISLLAKDLNITGNDFSAVQITFTDVDSGGVIDLSGNNWGTTDREVILARLGKYADNVYLGELSGEYIGTEVFTVTSTNDNGEGSLRWALAQAAAYVGARRTEIRFSEAVEGNTITLLSDLAVSSKTRIVASASVGIVGAGLRVTEDLHLENIALERMILADAVTLTGSGNTLTGTGAVLTVENPNTYLGLLDIAVQNPEDSYIAVSGSVNNGALSLDSIGLPYHVVSDAEITGLLTIDAGEHLMVEPGVALEWYGHQDMKVYGKLTIENDTLTDVISNSYHGNASVSSDYHMIYVYDGAEVSLKNSNIDLGWYYGSLRQIRVEGDNAVVNVEGGTFDASFYMYYSYGSLLNIEGATVNGYVGGYSGTGDTYRISIRDSHVCSYVSTDYSCELSIENSTIDGELSVSNKSSAVVNESRLNGSISNSGNLMLNNCEIAGYFNITSTGALSNVVGSGNIFTGQKVAEVSSLSYISVLSSHSSLFSEIRAVNPYVELAVDGYSSEYAPSIDSDTVLELIDGFPSLAYKLVKGWNDFEEYDPVVPPMIISTDTTLTIQEGASLILGGGSAGYVRMTGWLYDYDLLPFARENGSVDLFYNPSYHYLPEFQCYNLNNGLHVKGNLNAVFEKERDAITASEDYVRLVIGGTDYEAYGALALKNANVSFIGEESDVHVLSGSSAGMENGSFLATSGWLNMGSTTMTGVEVFSKITNAQGGSLTLDGTEHYAEVLIEDGSVETTIRNTLGITTLTIQGSSDGLEISGNDFSGTTIDISSYSGSKIDLSGNYWGEGATLESITAQIIGYSESLVDIGFWLSDAPVRADRLVVTNTNDSGEGSLRWALDLVASSVASVKPKVVFAAELSGQVITLSDELTVASDVELECRPGVTLCSPGLTVYGKLKADVVQMQGGWLEIYGTLVAENADMADAITGDGTAYLRIYDGGSLKLKNANINGVQFVSVITGGAFEMNGGMLETQDGTFIDVGASASLTNVTVNEYVECFGSLHADNCEFQSFVSVAGDAVVSGSGNVFTGEETYRLTEFYAGNTAELLTTIGSVTAEGAYISLSGSLGSCTLANIPSGLLPGGYQSKGDVYVADGAEVSLEPGACLRMQGTDRLFVDGVLVEENASVADAIVGGAESGALSIRQGGSLSLKNANLVGLNNVLVSNGSMEMSGGTLDTRSYLQIVSSGSVVLDGVDVQDYIVCSGVMSLLNCNLNSNTVTVNRTATATIQNTSGISSLSISVGSNPTVITGNDFSTTTIKLSSLDEGETIDLSGNYWGTTNKEEIIAKIQGYNAERVILDSWLVGDDSNAFKLNGIVESGVLSASSDRVTLSFSHSVDTGSLTSENLYIESLLGERVEIMGYTVEGGNLVLHFAPLSADGQYNIVVGNTIKSTNGQTIALGEEKVSLSVMADVTAESVEEIRLPESDTLTFIDVMLSGEISPATVSLSDIELTSPNGSDVAVTGWNMPTKRILRLYVENLSTLGEYTLTLPPALADAAGNVLSTSSATFNVQSIDPSVEPADTVYSGLTNGSVEVSFTVNNAGNLAAENAKVEIWLTENGTVTESSVLLDIATIETLAAGGSTELTRSLLLSDVPGLLSGNYQLVVTVSGANELTVLTNDNSGCIGSLEVAYPPAADLELGISGVSAALTPGQTASMALTLRNVGDSTAQNVGEILIGIIPAGGSAADMVQVGSRDLTGLGLNAGVTIHISAEVAIPADIRLGGDVQLVAVLKTDVYEQPGTTANNTAVSETVQLEQLLSISTSVDSITEGSSTRVVYTITRTGDCSKALAVNLSSEQAARLGLPETVTIAAGQSSARVQYRVVNDSDYTGNVDTVISVNAAGYTGASTGLTIVDDEKPSITVQLEPTAVTEGVDTVVRGTVSMNTVSTTDTVIKLGCNLSSQLNVPSTVIIKAGETSASFEATVVDDTTAEIDKDVKITAAATGFNSGSATVTVADNDLPQVELVLNREIVSESDGYYALTATLVRTGGSTEAITVKLTDVDGIGLILPTSVPMGAGVTNVKFTIGVVDDALANGERTGKIRGTIIIDDCGCDASTSTNGGVFESTVTVQDNDSPALTVSLSKTVLREGGEEVAILTVTSNYVSDVPVVVTLSDGGLLNLPSTITIPAGSTSATCEVSAKADGVSDGTQYTTITATADGFISGRGYMQVTDMDMPDLVVDSITLDGAAIAGQKVSVSVIIRNQGYVATESAAVVEIRLSDGTVLGTVSVPTGLAAGADTTLSTEVTLPQVSGQYSLVAEIDKLNNLDELDNTNNIKAGSPFYIDSGYGISVDVQQEVLLAERVINLTGSLTSEVADAPLEGITVILRFYQGNALFDTIQVQTNSLGSFNTTYEIPGNAAGDFSVRAELFGGVSDTLDSFSVAGLNVSATSQQRQWDIIDGQSVTGEFTVVNTGSVELTGVTLISNLLPPNIIFEVISAPVDLKPGESAEISYRITGNGVDAGTFYSVLELSATSNEGVTDAFKGYTFVETLGGELYLDVRNIEFRGGIDSVRYVEISMTNIGGGDTGAINVSLPALGWMSVYSGGTIDNLAAGESATVVLKFDPTADDSIVSNALFTGKIAINAENASSQVVSFDVRFVEAETASLSFKVMDSFTLANADNALVEGARVTLYDSYTLEVIDSVLVNEEGIAEFTNLVAGYYNYKVEAPDYSSYKGTVQLHSGEDAQQGVYLTGSDISYTFNVVPSEIEDKYEIVQEVTYVTNVPRPVIVFNDNKPIYLPEMNYGETYYLTASISNYGLVAARDYSMVLPQFEGITLSLINPTDTIQALSSYEFIIKVEIASVEDMPETVSDKGATFSLKCLWGTVANFWLDCTDDGYWTLLGDVKTDDNCASEPGGSNGDDKPKNDDDGGGRPSKKPNPLRYPEGSGELPNTWNIIHCTPCMAALANYFMHVAGLDKYSLKDKVLDTVKSKATDKALSKAGDVANRLGVSDTTRIIGEATVSNAISGYDTYKSLGGINAGARDVLAKCQDYARTKWIESVEARIKAMEEMREKLLKSSAGSIPTLNLEPVLGKNQVTAEELEDFINRWKKALNDVKALEGKGASTGELTSEEAALARITDEERADLLGSAFALKIQDDDYLISLIEKWNRTVDYQVQGIYSVNDLSEGMNQDFYSTEYFVEWFRERNELLMEAERAGFTDYYSYVENAFNELREYATNIQDGVCASVRLQFSQSATMVREAFDGTFTLTNGIETGGLTNVNFYVFVQDQNGVDVSDHFRISYYGLSGMDSIQSGTLASGATAEVKIQYIADTNIAQNGPEKYLFGAYLSYTDPQDNVSKTLNITPVELTVNPSPSLNLHYFLTEDVYSDDPFTDSIEAAQRAEIGLIVSNVGRGTAKNFTLSDFHPEFLENEKGLALELNMLGSSLNGGELQQSGTGLAFGNIEGGATSTAIWYFQTNMQGYFADYEATFSRVDSLGDQVLVTNNTDVSLIESVTTHMLTRSMNADGDSKTDFLVNDKADIYDMADGLYFGDGSYADVNGVTVIQSSTGSLGMGRNTITLTMYAAEGWNYFRVNDPGAGNYRIESISVGGVELDASMFWQTDRVFAVDGSATYIDRLHWVAEFTQSGYVDFTITYSSVDEKAPGVKSISGVSDKSTVREAVDSLTVTFDEAVNTSTFSLENIKLKLQNEYVDLTGLTWEWVDDKTLRLTNLGQFTQNEGLYVLQVLNGGVEDVYGNAGDGSGRQLMWTYATTKVALVGVAGHTDRRLNAAVSELFVEFTEAVSEFGPDALTIIHTALDGTETVLPSILPVQIMPYLDDNKTYVIRNLEALQTIGDGTYRVVVDSSKVTDAVGKTGTGTLPAEWELHQTPPSVVEHSFDETEQIVQNIDTINLHFSHAVGMLDISKLTLACNGEVYTSDSLSYTIDANDPTLVIVKGISKAVPAGKAAAMPDGEWKLTMDMSGVEDIYGNLGSGTYSTDWEVDTMAPTALSGITLNGRENLIVADSTVTVGAELPEAGLKVSIYDRSVTGSGNGTLLWSGVVEGTALSQSVTLLNGATRVLTIVTEDAAGNATTNSYNVLVDMVVLTASTDLAAKYKEQPESITITFNAAVNGLPMEALSMTLNGEALSMAGLTLTKLSDTQWQLSGLSSLGDTVGSYALSIDLSQLSKAASGLVGQGSYTQSYTYDPVTEVRIINCELNSSVEKVTGLSISFSTGINYAALQEAGLLSDAVRLVNQADGSVVELDAAGFSYSDKLLSWSGELALPGGSYAVVVDAALLTAANGSPLVGSAGAAQTGITAYTGDAFALGAAGSTYSAPYAVDWNGDGYTDLLVGEKVGSEGKVRLYLNNGSGGFANFSYLQSNGSDLSVAASGCQGIVVALQDITGDGIADLVAGLSNGTVQYYVGTASGSFGSATVLFDSTVAGSRAYPTFHDWNGDGVTDLVLGTGSGSLMVGLGTLDAGTGALSFATPTGVAGIEVPGRAAPVFTDVNGDGTADLILGAGDGSLTLYYGTDSGYHKVGSWSLPGISWERSRVTVADLNGDGTGDLIVGGSTGDVYVVYGAKGTNCWTQSVEIEAGAAITSTAVSAEGKTATLSWVCANVKEDTRYTVEVADNAAFTGAVQYTGLSAARLTLENLAEGSYYWRVVIEGSDKPAVSGTGFTVDTIAPVAPENLLSSIVDNTAVLSWGAQSDPSGVKYEVRYSATADDFSASTVITTTEPTLNLSGLASGTWYWQVRAVDGAGNAGEWSTAAESFFIEDIVAPEPTSEHYWADGLLTADNKLVNGWWDADKSGTGDTQLCWASASANMLAWWQTQYGVNEFTSSVVPTTADGIFSSFVSNWANVSGRESYGLTWWISGASESDSYTAYYDANFTGSATAGGYYAPHYGAADISGLVREVSLTGVSAEQVASDWSSVYAEGGIMSLGVYGTLSNGSLLGGHTLTLWGFATDASGRLSSITVTDSDDRIDSVLTLNLAYNVTKGYYQIAQSGSSLNGYLLGDYTELGAFTEQDAENNSINGAEEIILTAPNMGSCGNAEEIRNWVGLGDTEDYYRFTATGKGTYSIDLGAEGVGDAALWLSLGTMEDGEFVVQKQVLVQPESMIHGLDGIRLDVGADYYIRVSNASDSPGAEYKLSISGDIDRDALITANNSLTSAIRLTGTMAVDGTINGWVGRSDATDFYRFDMSEAGSVKLMLANPESMVRVSLYKLQSNGVFMQTQNITVKSGSGLDRTLRLAAGTYAIEVSSYDKGAGSYNTSYALEIEKTIGAATERLIVPGSSLSDNNTRETASELIASTDPDDTIVGWVGSEDVIDYYRLELSSGGKLNLSLSGLEANIKIKVYQERNNGSVVQRLSSTVSADNGLDRTLSLTSGTYFVEVSSYDNGAGRYNTTYALELEQEEENGETRRFTIANA